MKAIGVVGIVILVSCSSVKPAVRTVHDVSRALCSVYFGDRQGISVEDASRAYCDTEPKLRPWLDEVLLAQRAAAARVNGEPSPDGAEPWRQRR